MMKVLFIDDERIILTLMTHLLPPESYQVYTAGSVAEAWEILEQVQPDVICCDLVMPGVSGLDFLTQYRQKVSESVPVIVLSGSKEYSLLNKAFNLGAVANLSKPFTGQDLITLLDDVTQPPLS
ncbi:MAG: response regulator [Chloroflexota bacterium]|nr:response regulator [Anaerolineales bacterium]MCA9977807.1 response regulator [Anaerolineales bacterium]